MGNASRLRHQKLQVNKIKKEAWKLLSDSLGPPHARKIPLASFYAPYRISSQARKISLLAH